MSYLEILKARKTAAGEPAKPSKPPVQPGLAGRVVGGLIEMPDDLPWLTPLTEPERSRLIVMADIWGMDADERAVMLRQCERGGQAVDGTKITPEEARAFWLAEAGKSQYH
jgi:hypothetical protein